MVWIEQAMAASVGMTSGPIEIAPWGERSQSVSGNSKVAVPVPASTKLIPVRREMGGRGVRPASISPSCSMPGRSSRLGSG